MPVYDKNILPEWSKWSMYNGAYEINGHLTILNGNNKYAEWQFNTKDFNAGNYARIAGGAHSSSDAYGLVFFHLSYKDTETQEWLTTSIKVPPSGVDVTVILPTAKTDALVFRVDGAGYTIQPFTFQLVEQAIRSVDIEYASGTSKRIPPETGWQTYPPAWQTNRYIWQRTATTFVDGHTEYSDPICIQNLDSSAIYAIEEQYYLSISSSLLIGGSWSTEQPTWSSGKYIWTRSKITWTDNTTTYSDNTLAQALNQANERAEEAMQAVEQLDKDLSPDGVFNRLTDNGKRQGIYIEDNNYYINASYIQSGVFSVVDDSGDVVFRADKDGKYVRIAGFNVKGTNMYQGTNVFGSGTGSGTYVGSAGLWTQKDGFYTYLQDGVLSGGVDGDVGGYIGFRGRWADDNTLCMRLAAFGGVFFLTPRLGVGYYTGPSYDATVTLGCTGTFQACSPLREYALVHSIQKQFIKVVSSLSMAGVPDTMSASWTMDQVLQNISWATVTPGTKSVHFTSGLMTTQLN